MFNDIPPLVDSRGEPPTIPPPPGASFGYDQFSGAQSHHGTPWGAPLGIGTDWSPGPATWGGGLPNINHPYDTHSPSQWSAPPAQAPWPSGFDRTPSLGIATPAPNAWGTPLGSWLAQNVSVYAPQPAYFGAAGVGNDPYRARTRSAGYNSPWSAQAPLTRQTAYQTPLLRSNSAQGLQMSPFAGGPSHHSAWSRPGPDPLARRPRDWRPDYKARTGLASFLPRRRSNSSSTREFSDNVKRYLHNSLFYLHTKPSVTLDLRADPNTIEFHILGRPYNPYDLLQFACEPPVPFMRLYHDRLPWFIDIYAKNPSGVTIHDLFDQLHDALMMQIHNKHYYNEDMDDEDRGKIARAFDERCAGDSTEIASGVRRVDFLRGRVLFEGLTRGKNGMWEMKTRKPDL